jgi:pimeloyl-ACP methyl ester carboxylesterase
LRTSFERVFDEAMADPIRWLDLRDDDGVVDRAFMVGGVPGVVWHPSRRPPPLLPLVLLGHGGSGHKRDGRIVARAREFVRDTGLAAVAIDGPHHGDRRPAPLSPRDYQERIVEEGVDRVADRLAADWVSTADALDAAGIADGSRVAYVGLSMGARFGIPTAVALGERLRCAVFGKFGLVQVPDFPAGYQTSARIRTDAARVMAPTLLHVQWDDELFPLAGQLELFDLLGSPDKRLMAQPGAHGATRPDAERAWRDFVRTHI